MSLTVKSVETGVVDARCYLLKDEKTGLAAVVDCGAYSSDVIQMLKENSVEKLEYILLTHGHFDHIYGVAQLQRQYGGEVTVHNEDAGMLSSPLLNLASTFRLSNFECIDSYKTVHEDDEIILGESVIRVLHTPGHTQGSVCYITDGVIFSGDTLFQGSIGRTDFPGGNMKKILESITRIAALPGDYRLYPGHGEETTLEHERQTNGYLRNRI